MSRTTYVLYLGLIGLTIGWVLALRSLSALGLWAPAAALAFIALVGWLVLRHARI